jgi:uncharacterized protein (TIGR04222 family)
VVVDAPVAIERTACFAGPQGSTDACDAMRTAGARATFTQKNLFSYSGLTIVVAVPVGTIHPPPQPIIETPRTLGDAFAVRPNTVWPAAAIAALAIGWVMRAARRGRDRRIGGTDLDAALGLGDDGGYAEMGAPAAGPVEFVPPDGLRPGEIGTLVDEQANLVDVTATIIDLAVRGWLTITEVGSDYELAATQNAGRGTLLPYETALMDALFKAHPVVRLSSLKYEFVDDLNTIRTALYDNVVTKGWYRRRPDTTRMLWIALAILFLVVSVAATIVVALTTSFGLVPLGLVVAALVLIPVGRRMPSRTGKGRAALARAFGFRRLFDEGDEGIRVRFAEQQGIFAKYLPFAIVFGETDRWARAFEGLDDEQLGMTSGWYRGSNSFDLSAVSLAHALDDFGTRATGTLYATRPSSSGGSGFSGGGGGSSGGGGGGGGGGSW